MGCKSEVSDFYPLVAMMETTRDIEAVSVAILGGTLDGGRIVDRLNEVRLQADLTYDTLRSQYGADAAPLCASLAKLLDSVTRIGEIAIALQEGPRSVTVEKPISVRGLVFDRFGSLDKVDEFIALNPQLVSLNFIDPGTVVNMPQGAQG